MKLFVWANPYRIAFGSTMVFAVAETEESAREQVRKGDGYSYAEFPESPPRTLDLGPPTRVVDCPCAEWHQWSE